METLNDYVLTGTIDDLSSTSSALFIPVPRDFTGKIIEIRSVLGGSISTTAAVITCSISGTAITGGALTIAVDVDEGDVDVVYPTAANTVVGGTSYIKAIVSTATTGAVPAGTERVAQPMRLREGRWHDEVHLLWNRK